MNTIKIVANNHEAEMIVNAIINNEENAEDILNRLEKSGLVGDKLVDYFENYFADNSPSFEADVHNFAESVCASL